MTELTTTDRERLKQMLIDYSIVAVYYGNKVYNMPLRKAKEIATKMNITVEELIASEPEDDS